MFSNFEDLIFTADQYIFLWSFCFSFSLMGDFSATDKVNFFENYSVDKSLNKTMASFLWTLILLKLSVSSFII